MKKFLSIFLLSIFLFAQFGKVVSYVYCKWETRSEVRCDCEKILTHDDHQDGKQLAKLNANPRWEEPIIAEWCDLPVNEIKLFASRIESNSPHITKGFTGLPFHPPSEV